ncbi:MAG: hypothetical protein DRO00_08540 [Thermoproteota archaeon]|nr:MAG: hypothetical protein DRO00_08540 [Candidatus Korarchaeota archaeon]
MNFIVFRALDIRNQDKVRDPLIESRLRESIREIALARGIESERALKLVSDLVLAFLYSITDLPKTDLIEEWKLVAFRAKMPPVCKHPCQFSYELEKVLMKAGFRNIHYHLIISALGALEHPEERKKS